MAAMAVEGVSITIRHGTRRACTVFLLITGLIIPPLAQSAPRQAGAGPTAYPTTIDFGKATTTPTPAQAAAIRRAAGNDLNDCHHPDQDCYSVALADLNDDGRPDLLVQYHYDTGYCGSAGCSGVIVMATPQGYARRTIGMPNFYGVMAVLAGKHHGMHDIEFNDNGLAWKWSGTNYEVEKVELPGSEPAAWELHSARGTIYALAIPIDSTIKSLIVYCDQGQPVLAMRVKVRPPAGPVTLTFGFRGWTVNVPMTQEDRDARLWLSNLSNSTLPQWLAHRGDNPTTRSLARAAEMSFLSINGATQGEISLKHSARTTQAALDRCYRY
jgi:hypothetical protein